MTNELFIRHAGSSDRELSGAELDAVAGGFDPSFYHRVGVVARNFANVFTHPPVSTLVVKIIRGIGSIFHW